jgi:hypothetical protein
MQDEGHGIGVVQVLLPKVQTAMLIAECEPWCFWSSQGVKAGRRDMGRASVPARSGRPHYAWQLADAQRTDPLKDQARGPEWQLVHWGNCHGIWHRQSQCLSLGTHRWLLPGDQGMWGPEATAQSLWEEDSAHVSLLGSLTGNGYWYLRSQRGQCPPWTDGWWPWWFCCGANTGNICVPGIWVMAMSPEMWKSHLYVDTSIFCSSVSALFSRS